MAAPSSSEPHECSHGESVEEAGWGGPRCRGLALTPEPLTGRRCPSRIPPWGLVATQLCRPPQADVGPGGGIYLRSDSLRLPFLCKRGCSVAFSFALENKNLKRGNVKRVEGVGGELRSHLISKLLCYALSPPPPHTPPALPRGPWPPPCACGSCCRSGNGLGPETSRGHVLSRSWSPAPYLSSHPIPTTLLEGSL